IRTPSGNHVRAGARRQDQRPRRAEPAAAGSDRRPPPRRHPAPNRARAHPTPGRIRRRHRSVGARRGRAQLRRRRPPGQRPTLGRRDAPHTAFTKEILMTTHDNRTTTTRRGLLGIATVGLGAAIGGAIVAPIAGYALAPTTTETTFRPVSLGPVSSFTSE